MSDDLVEIYRGTGGPLRAEILRSVLQQAGVEASIQKAGLSSAYPVNVGALGEFSLWVKRTDAERAAATLAAADEDGVP